MSIEQRIATWSILLGITPNKEGVNNYRKETERLKKKIEKTKKEIEDLKEMQRTYEKNRPLFEELLYLQGLVKNHNTAVKRLSKCKIRK